MRFEVDEAHLSFLDLDSEGICRRGKTKQSQSRKKKKKRERRRRTTRATGQARMSRFLAELGLAVLARKELVEVALAANVGLLDWCGVGAPVEGEARAGHEREKAEMRSAVGHGVGGVVEVVEVDPVDVFIGDLEIVERRGRSCRLLISVIVDRSNIRLLRLLEASGDGTEVDRVHVDLGQVERLVLDELAL